MLLFRLRTVYIKDFQFVREVYHLTSLVEEGKEEWKTRGQVMVSEGVQGFLHCCSVYSRALPCKSKEAWCWLTLPWSSWGPASPWWWGNIQSSALLSYYSLLLVNLMVYLLYFTSPQELTSSTLNRIITRVVGLTWHHALADATDSLDVIYILEFSRAMVRIYDLVLIFYKVLGYSFPAYFIVQDIGKQEKYKCVEM